MDLKLILLFGFIAGIGGCVAGAVFTYPIRMNRRAISIFLESFSGFMLAVICFCLVPGAFRLGTRYMTFLGLAGGAAFSVALQSLIKYIPRKISENQTRVRATGAVLSIVCILINFTEGFALGSGFWISAAVGIPAFIVITLNNMPKGAVICAVLRFSKVKTAYIFMICVLLGLPTGIGTVIGMYIGGACPDSIAAAVSFAAGAMLYITEGELIPESKRLYTGRSSGFFNVLGIVLGAIIIYII